MNPSEARLEIYYRVSERDAFTLLGTVTSTKIIENVNTRVEASAQQPLEEQRYQFTKFDALNAALPEFNEIQFKFKLFRGFSIIGAWLEYSYISRNTLN